MVGGTNLEDAVPPQAILFAAQHPEVGHSAGFLNQLKKSLAKSVFLSVPYLLDCIAALAEGMLAATPNFNRNITIDQPSETALVPAVVNDPERYLLALCARFMDRSTDHLTTAARILWACGLEEWHEIRWIPKLADGPRPTDVLERFNAILTSPKGFVTTVTFKTKGDALIHNLLKALHLAPWQTTILRTNEAPYALISQAYGRGTNDVVRQYLDAKIESFLRPSRTIDPAVVFTGVAALVQEAGGHAVELSVNRAMIQRDHITPAMFITTECPLHPGTPVFGVIHNRTATVISDPHDAILDYIYAARTCVPELESLASAIFEPDRMEPGCPFAKFVFSESV